MLRGIEFFAGIGSQKKALKNKKIEHEIIGISEWEVNAIISYDAIHTNDGIDYTEGMTKLEVLDELKDFVFSTDGKKPCDLKRVKEKTLRQLYNANKRSKNMGDITKINKTPVADFWTYSFPCQDLSIAGKRAGLENRTRSGLLYEIERLLDISKINNELPKYLILENVKNLVGKEFKPAFDEWLEKLENLGYNNYWKILNGKECGVPQNRERVFVVSVRKDIDCKVFEFPEPFDSGLRLKDFLETNVDEKYYISNEKVDKLIDSLKGKKILGPGIQISNQAEKFEKNTEFASTLLARDYKGFVNQDMTAVITKSDTNNIKTVENYTNSNHDASRVVDSEGIAPTVKENHGTVTGVLEDTNKLIQAGNLEGGKWDKINESCRRYYSSEGIAPTIHTCQGGNTEPKVLESVVCEERTDEGLRFFKDNVCGSLRTTNSCGDKRVIEKVNDGEAPSPDLVGGIGEMNFGKQYRQGNRIYNAEKTAMCLLSQPVGNAGGNSYLYVVPEDREPKYRVRKLTPTECWRMMAFEDSDIQKCIDIGVSNSQLYKQAGNSIIVRKLEFIFESIQRNEIELSKRLHINKIIK